MVGAGVTAGAVSEAPGTPVSMGAVSVGVVVSVGGMVSVGVPAGVSAAGVPVAAVTGVPVGAATLGGTTVGPASEGGEVAEPPQAAKTRTDATYGIEKRVQRVCMVLLSVR
jgi:hypothetical protein